MDTSFVGWDYATQEDCAVTSDWHVFDADDTLITAATTSAVAHYNRSRKVRFIHANDGDDWTCNVRWNTSATTTDVTTWGDCQNAVIHAVNTACTQFVRMGNWRVSNWDIVQPATPQDRLREIIQKRQAPAIIISRNPVQSAQDIREIRARETLCRVLGDDKYQRFLKDGFVSVRAKSGLIYQIFPGHGITKVYRDGEQIERLCVVLKGDFPPTDSLIMRYLIILNDESRFRGWAIKHQIIQKAAPTKQDERPLVEIFRDLKKQTKRVA